MNLEQIKAAVAAGKVVHWASDAYRVLQDETYEFASALKARPVIEFETGLSRVRHVCLLVRGGEATGSRRDAMPPDTARGPPGVPDETPSGACPSVVSAVADATG